MFKISQMDSKDIDQAMDLWYSSHQLYTGEGILPDFLPGGKKILENYFLDRIKNESAVIIKDKNNILGYFSWISFNFHNEKSAFCPIIGHFGVETCKVQIYTELYKIVSTEWVKNGIFNHLWMINNKDNFLKKFSYDLGFGSYVMDAYIKNGFMEDAHGEYKITRATQDDCDSIFELTEESRRYYLASPVFLKRNEIEKAEIEQFIKNDAVFLAWDNNDIIGLMSIGIEDEYNFEQLCTPETASIDRLGAYIKPNYRGKGIGKSLLKSVFQYCEDKKIEYIHVCFETANTYANGFWPKYFTPIISSVRRTVNKDANL